MIFITLMHQFNVTIDVKKVCGYVVNFCGYAHLARFGRDIHVSIKKNTNNISGSCPTHYF